MLSGQEIMALDQFNARRKTHRLRADYQDVLMAIGSSVLAIYVAKQ